MPKRTDMTEEEYEAICERLRKARMVAQEKLKNKKEVDEPVAIPAPVSIPEPEQEQESEEETHFESAPIQTPLPKPKKAVVSKSKPVEIAKPEVDLDSYFEAKYRAKAKYVPSYNHPYQDEVNRQVAQPQPQPSHLIQQTAKEQIRGRVNNEMFNLAMKSVFPTY